MTVRTLARLAIATLLGVPMALGFAGPMVPLVEAAAPLPACRYADLAVSNASYQDWALTQLDTIYRLPAGYAPPDLTPVSRAGLAGGGQVRALLIPDLTAMAKAAKAAGAALGVQSAYRSYATQVSTFAYWVKSSGYAAALLASARPGHSEHQLGTALDFKSAGGGSPFGGNWAKTKAGAWMAKNAWKYGFILSYPAASSPRFTCYEYEPWHYRYFGRTQAAAIHASGLTSRQWLWAHGGANRTSAAPVPTPRRATPPPARPKPVATTPVPSASVKPSASVNPNVSPSINPSSISNPSASPSASPALQSLGPTSAPNSSSGPSLTSASSVNGAFDLFRLLALVLAFLPLLALVALTIWWRGRHVRR